MENWIKTNCLRLKYDPENSVVTKEEYDRFIWFVGEMPKDRHLMMTPTNEPGRIKNLKVNIKLTDDTPWQARLRPQSAEDKLAIHEIITKNLKLGLIEPCQGAYACDVILERTTYHRWICVGPTRASSWTRGAGTTLALSRTVAFTAGAFCPMDTRAQAGSSAW